MGTMLAMSFASLLLRAGQARLVLSAVGLTGSVPAYPHIL